MSVCAMPATRTKIEAFVYDGFRAVQEGISGIPYKRLPCDGMSRTWPHISDGTATRFSPQSKTFGGGFDLAQKLTEQDVFVR